MLPRPRTGAAAILGVFLFTSPSHAEIASALLREGDVLPEAGGGQRITALNNTAANHVGGFAISLTTSNGSSTLSHIWGNSIEGPGLVLRTEGTHGTYVQTSFESFYGISDDGSIAYSASGVGGPVGGFDSVWLDNTVLMMEGEAYPHVPDQWWSFGTRPGVSGDGTPFWIGGITDVQGGNATNRGLFLGVGGTPLLIGGAALPHLPDLLSVDNTIGLDYRFSAAASHYICEVEMQGASATNNAIVIDGVGLVLDGSLVREGSTIPVDIGGEGAEAWDNFDFLGIAESGAWFLTGDSDGPASTDEVVVRNGEIILRQGDIVDGALLVGAIEGAYLNENGDLALIWDIRDPAVPANTLEVLLLNDRLLLQVGDEVDFDGDGELDVGAVVADFTGTSSLTLGDRDFAGEVAIWFTADVDTAGTASSTDDIEAFFVLHVDPQPIPVRLSGLSAEADPRTPIVTVQWHTSLEFDHAGFHVYRSDARHGHRERLTDRLVTGSRDYRWVDRKVQPSHSYFYEIGAVDTQGREVRYGPVPAQTPAWGLRTALAPGRPNPFVRRTQIEFTLARESRATLTIHDVAGRRVATLVDGMLPSGDHEVAWDGTTAGGRRGAAGIYFYRLETAGHSETRKLVRLQR